MINISKILKQIAVVAVMSVSAFTATAGEQYSFKHIDTHQGLSSNNVKCITRDRLGFMWIGTKNGLNRYDGSTMKRFDCYDAKLKRGNNNIGALYEDEQSNLWIGTDRGIYIYNTYSDCISYVDRVSSDGVKARNWVQRISGDKKGHVWALLPDEGVYLYTDDTVKHFQITNPENPKVVFPSDLCVDHNGNVWVVTAGAGIFKYDIKADRFISVNTQGNIDSRGILFCCISENDEGQLIIGGADGYIYNFNPITGEFKEIPFSKAGAIYLRYIECFEDEVWLGTHLGLYVVNRVTGAETFLTENPLDRFSLSDNTIYCIYRDEDGGAWIGSMFGGVNYMPRRKFKFVNYGINSNLSSRLVIGMASDIDGNVWIGTENAGVNILNPTTSEIKQAKCFPPSNNIVLMMTDYDGCVYTSFSRSGLVKIDINGRAKWIFPTAPEQDANVYSYLIDSRGNEWIGQGFALYRRNKGESNFRRISDTNYDWIYYILEASDGMIWFASMGNGVRKYNPANGTFKQYTYDHAASTPSGLKSNSTNSIMEDSNGNIWVSTERGGLSRYNKDTDDFTTYGIADGLPDDCVYSVLEDYNGNLWFGTNKGLVRFTPATAGVQVFTCEDGILGEQYNYKAAIRATDGRFYFGGINGVVSFVPEHYESSATPPPLYFTEMSVLNKPVTVAQDNSPLKENIVFTDEIKLNYDESTFAITVASPTYRQVGEVAFSYRLLPVSRDWVSMSDNEISFTNLAPGDYYLDVKVDNGTATNVKRLKIEILPPWWKSTWAYCGIAVMIMLLALAWFFWYRNRKEKQLKDSEQTFEINKEKELYRSKVNFFTEIAHEIRTPLSLIDLPLEAIEEIGVDNPDIMRYLKVSRQNTHRLLELTGQLLDFEKIDSNKLTLKKENVDVIAFIKEIVDRFEPTISLTGKQLIREIDNSRISVSIDREALTKIVSNLLNNALKYGQHTIRLTLALADGSFVIKVASDGRKIQDEERARIFQPFYQTIAAEEVKNGVGIGLPLSRSLAALLGGSLILESNDDEYNTFVLTIPITEEVPVSEIEMDEEMENYMIKEESNQAKPRSDIYNVLLVEDNVNILSFLTERLGQSFLVEVATNGQEALDKLKDSQYDIIVTDIMMPVMDGLELCCRVKEDINISHIPVVFITAKNDLDSKIKGLQYGAEAYVEKPFSIKYLKQLIRSLLDNRRRERESFTKDPNFSVDNMQMNDSNEEFMNRVQEIIEENVNEDGFTVETLCDLLCMSKSSLLRKIRALFNLSPIELIRLIKLKKAAEIIKEGHHRVSDVCFMVGIASPSYFSKMFYKQFGMTPKDYAKQCMAEDSPNGKKAGDDVVN